MRSTIAVLVLGLALSTAACSADEPVKPVETTQTAPPVVDDAQEPQEPVVSENVANSPDFTEDEIATHLGLDEFGMVDVKGTACEAPAILTSADMIDMYVEAGDTVVFNPDYTAGVKVTETSDVCVNYFSEKFMTL